MLLVHALDKDTASPISHAENTEFEEKNAAATDAESRNIRISVALIDRLLEDIADYSIASNDFSSVLKASAVSPKLQQAFATLTRMGNEIRATASQMRLQRMDRLFAPLPKAVRDLANACGKKVRIHTTGGSIELDRDMLHKLRDPITHIVRNAIDHGIEQADVRARSNKPEIGTIAIAAVRRGNDIEISISDDGAGLDTEAIRAKAIAKGLIAQSATGNSSTALDDRTISHIITSPGFSTRGTADAVSGRGVGLDVVRSNIESIGGHFELASTSGQGMSIRLRVPLSMSVASCLIVKVGKTSYYVPTESVQQIWLVGNPMIRISAVAGTHIISFGSQNLPVVAIENMVGNPANQTGVNAVSLGCTGPEYSDIQDKVVIAMQAPNGAQFAFMVDDALEYTDAVIRPIPPVVANSGPYAGVSLQDNGTAILLLDILELAQFAQAQPIDTISENSQAETDVRVRPNGQMGELSAEVSVVETLDGKIMAIPFAHVRRVEKYDEKQHIAMDSAHWLKTTSGLLPMVVAAKDNPATCVHMMILGHDDGSDALAWPVLRVVSVIQAGHIQYSKHRNAKHQGAFCGVMLLDNVPVPVINFAHMMASYTQGASNLIGASA
jgi:two-component system chemotaxis sensor kinase CheA